MTDVNILNKPVLCQSENEHRLFLLLLLLFDEYVKEQKLMKVGLYLISLVSEEFSQGYSSVKTWHSLQHHRSHSMRTPAGLCTCSSLCVF